MSSNCQRFRGVVKSAEDTDYSDAIGGTDKVRRRVSANELRSVSSNKRVICGVVCHSPHSSSTRDTALAVDDASATNRENCGRETEPYFSIRIAETLPVCFLRVRVNEREFPVKEGP